MALSEVPQLLSSEVKIRPQSPLDPGLFCASRWSSVLNKPGTRLEAQPVVPQGGRGCICLPRGTPLPAEPGVL